MQELEKQAKSHGLSTDMNVNNMNNNYGTMLVNSFLNKASSPTRNPPPILDIKVSYKYTALMMNGTLIEIKEILICI